MDWQTLIAAFLGGTAGALITAATNSRIARAIRRNEAARALWEYHYALAGFGARAGDELQDEMRSLLEADWEQVKQALRTAYPYAGYLTRSARNRLFRRAWISINTDPWQEWHEEPQARHNTFSDLATVLESDLQWAFPQRFGDRFRGLVGRCRAQRARSSRVSQL